MAFLFPPLWLLLVLAPSALANFTQTDSAKAVAYCQGGSFMNTVVLGKDPDNARVKAKAEIAQNLISKVKSETNMANYSEENDGILKESSKFLEKGRIESDLTLIGFQEMEFPKLQENGGYLLRAYVCVKDIAKPYLEKQRILAESIEMSKDWHKIQNSWNEFMSIQILLEGLRVESKYLASAKKSYDKAKKDYKEHCNAKTHWNPEKKTTYSDIAFSKLSGSIKMENTPCAGKGISLVYKGEPICKSSGGPYGCSYQPSLKITSCNGAELRLLESPAPVKGFDQKEEIALKKLQDKLKTENFWNEWEQEIKQRSPQCEQ
ncbi:MAG: hypothetical protein LBC75_13315 [Fibromonadaceae bacterium]|jgi:hypothetical protein|nr:hypothetical protein [Fibromonadaceae bacterium]